MTLAASIDTNIIYLIAAAAYGVFAWWNDRRQKQALEEEEKRHAQAQQNQQQGNQAPAVPTTTNSEAERTRRFLEALGVPTNQLPPPPRPAPAPKPQPKPASPTMAPRPIAMPIPQMPRPMTRPQPAPVYTPPPKQVRPVVPIPHIDEPLPAESRDSGRIEEPAAAMSQISVDFARMHAENVATAYLPIDATGSAPTTRVEGVHISVRGLALRDLLRSPEGLRTAFVMSEVLGRPRGE
jgi:hypothetical protein